MIPQKILETRNQLQILECLQELGLESPAQLKNLPIQKILETTNPEIVRSLLHEADLLPKKPENFLIKTPTGLNDLFACVAYHIQFFAKFQIPLEKLYITHPGYENLANFFEFKTINFIENPNPKDFVPLGFSLGIHTNSALHTTLHLSNFVKINPEILEHTKPFAKEIGVHFRSKETEASNLIGAEKEIELQKEKFTKRYLPEKEYFVCADNPSLNEFLQEYPNVHFIPKTKIESKTAARKENTMGAIFDLATLSQCETLFKTEGSFTSLANALSGGKKPVEIL
jgi:hypothetical protein